MEILEPGEIPLSTKKGNRIRNHQEDKIPLGKVQAYKKTMETKYPLVKRKGYSSIYNCHGLAFASRRTSINDLSELGKIIKDDEYIEIIDPEKVMPGDIAIYFDLNNGEITHSAIVISEYSNTLLTKVVVSKWGGGEEIVHGERNCPYAEDRIKYFRMKLDEI